MLNTSKIKADFPILKRQVNGQPLTYLDNAATSQKPKQVIEAISNYYQTSNANVHRGVHTLSDESTTAFEKAHLKIAKFFGAADEELVLVRNTTEAINGLAYGWLDHNLEEGDIVLTSLMEHHSNLVVWQQACLRNKAKLEFIKVTADGQLDWADLAAKLGNSKVKFLALVHVSNTLGTLNSAEEISKLVKQAEKKHDRPIRVLLDIAQSAPHMKLNFAKTDIDFMAFSGHKMLGPMGIGGLLIKKELLKVKDGEMKPWLFGGGMIDSVATDKTIFNQNLVERFQAGTPDVASTVGLAVACDYLTNLGMDKVEAHDRELVAYAIKKLQELPEVEVVGPTQSDPSTKQLNRLGSVAFTYKGVHAHDVAQVLDSQGVAVRSGHHCTMPLHTHFGWQATLRASFQIYNNKQDIDTLLEALKKVGQTFKK